MRPEAGTIRAWRRDPVLFVRQCLKAEPDAWQVEVLRAYGCDPAVNPEHKQRFALKASKGPGKTTLLAWLGLHFLVCYPHPKGVATSISGDNLKDNLWTELAKWIQKSQLLKSIFTWTAERIFANDHRETWWLSARTWPKDADATKQSDTLAGIHADHVLFLIDEAGGIPDAVVATAEGGLSSTVEGSGKTARIVMAGNPTETSGPLYRACTRERHLWWVKEISGDPDDPNRAPRVSIQWAREQIEKFGRDNPWVLVNVFGQFPPTQSNALLGIEEVGQAAKRVLHDSEYVYDTKILGVDVAREGSDRSVIFPRQGRVAFRPSVFRNLDTMELTGRVIHAINTFRPDAVFVDAIGVGAGVADRLRQLNFRMVEGIQSAGRATRTEPRLANMRAQMWWDMAEWLRAGAAIPDDPELISELTAPTYRFNNSGAFLLERKEDLKKRGLPSPDLADALALTFCWSGLPSPRMDPAIPGAQQETFRALTDYDPYAQERL